MKGKGKGSDQVGRRERGNDGKWYRRTSPGNEVSSWVIDEDQQDVSWVEDADDQGQGCGSLEECSYGLGSGMSDGYEPRCDICALDGETAELSDTYEDDRDEFVKMLKLSENKARELEPSISDKPEVDPLSESDAWSDYLILSGKSIGRSISSTPMASSLTGCALALSSDEFLLKYSDVAKSVNSAAGKMSPEEFALAYKEGTIVAVDPTNDERSEVLQVPRSWSQPASEMRGHPVANRWKRRVAAVATGVEEAHVDTSLTSGMGIARRTAGP